MVLSTFVCWFARDFCLLCAEILFLEVGGRGQVIHILGYVTMMNANSAPETLKLEGKKNINNLTK